MSTVTENIPTAKSATQTTVITMIIVVVMATVMMMIMTTATTKTITMLIIFVTIIFHITFSFVYLSIIGIKQWKYNKMWHFITVGPAASNTILTSVFYTDGAFDPNTVASERWALVSLFVSHSELKVSSLTWPLTSNGLESIVLS